MHKLTDHSEKPYITVMAVGQPKTTEICVVVDGPIGDQQLLDLAKYLKYSTRMLLQLVEFGAEL